MAQSHGEFCLEDFAGPEAAAIIRTTETREQQDAARNAITEETRRQLRTEVA